MHPPNALCLATRPLPLFLTSPPTRRRGSSGYRGVRAHPSGSFCAEIRSGEMRLGLSTFNAAHEAARAYNTAAWRIRQPRRKMNFPEVATRERAHELAPPPQLVTDEDRRDNRRRGRRLGIAEMDEEAMVLWCQRFPEDIVNEREFYAQRRAERAAYHEDRHTGKATGRKGGFGPGRVIIEGFSEEIIQVQADKFILNDGA
ncbi:uncharacterized protein [Aegilops tauschii subsp. strangulata]|uniref:uncharacterized protein n=1 Tax=Aegilops tauschii subsp. strangulata TaxID=200361 RepID=UPI00098B6366|nr:ethylene-responsive transcription factor ERF053-like [Aegilops tauschii subsp. strangulata]